MSIRWVHRRSPSTSASSMLSVAKSLGTNTRKGYCKHLTAWRADRFSQTESQQKGKTTWMHMDHIVLHLFISSVDRFILALSGHTQALLWQSLNARDLGKSASPNYVTLISSIVHDGPFMETSHMWPTNWPCCRDFSIQAPESACDQNLENKLRWK